MSQPTYEHPMRRSVVGIGELFAEVTSERLPQDRKPRGRHLDDHITLLLLSAASMVLLVTAAGWQLL